EVRGLCLQVSAGGGKSWLLRYQINFVKRWMGLGSASEFTLREARERARKARQLIADGIDPLEAKPAERAKQAQAQARVLNFHEATQRYYDANNAGWSNAKYAAQFLSTLRQHVFPIIGNLDVAAIDTPDVLQVMEQHVEAEHGYPAGTFWTARTV